jgi:acyl carrier protein
LLVQTQVHAQVRGFISETFLFGAEAPGDDDSLLAAGVIDSTGVLELVTFLESAFGITVGDADIVPDNLDSVARITAFVHRAVSGQPSEVAA